MLEFAAIRPMEKTGTIAEYKNGCIFEVLTDRYILFGEWCYAQHSVFYNYLPDWFLGFDLYDKQTCKFLSTKHRDKAFRKMKISKVPFIAAGHFSFSALKECLSLSKISNQPAEGLYLRIDQETGWYNELNWFDQHSFSQLNSIGRNQQLNPIS